MTFKTLLRTGSAAAIAAAFSIGALPSAVQAQDGRHGRWQQTDDRDQAANEARVEARQARQQTRAAQAPQRSYQAPQQQSTYQSPVAQERSGRDWNRGDRRSDTAVTRSGRDWNQSGQWQAQAQARAQAQAQAQAAAGDRAQRWGGQDTVRSGDNRWQRNRTYSDAGRNQSYRDQNYRSGQTYRSDQYRQQQAQNAYRSGYRDGDRNDNRSWSRDWRSNNRYNWYSYRNSNRNVFQLGSYYSPYRNYSYSRVNIGFRLGSLFFGSRYWINDPWQYRLPEAYGPYRWIRYYDDALLVDTYSGEVVDVIYDFFW